MEAQRQAELKKRRRNVSETKRGHRLEDGAWWHATLAGAPSERRGSVSRRGRRVAHQTVGLPFEDVVLRTGLSSKPGDEPYDEKGVDVGCQASAVEERREATGAEELSGAVANQIAGRFRAFSVQRACQLQFAMYVHTAIALGRCGADARQPARACALNFNSG